MMRRESGLARSCFTTSEIWSMWRPSGVGQLRHLRGRPVEIAVVEEQLQAAQDLLRRAADKADDQGRGEKAKTRDRMQDRKIARRQLKRRRRLNAAKARSAKRGLA